MKNKKLKGIAIAAVTIFSGIGVVTASLAWFIDMVTYSFEQVDLQANSGGAYFAYGTGANEQNAYGIASPRHLYNLAWMQYLGMFEDKQYYFELANDVDMTGYYLPPIGTDTYPFLGHFDGQGYSITGLTVTNSYSDYTGYSKAPEEVSNSDFVAPIIVGFFGVIGKLPDTETTYTYSSAVNTFTDTTLNSITINGAGTSTLLTGLAAGYVSGDLSGIKVGGNSTINVSGQGSTSFTDKLTDYGLVGYSTRNGTNGTYSQELSEFYDDNPGGDGNDWGGSIDMKALNNRIYYIFNNLNPTFGANYFAYYQTNQMKLSFGRGGTQAKTYVKQNPNTTQTYYLLQGNGTHYSGSTGNNSVNLPGTVMPLLVNTDMSTSTKNTGYIVGDTRKTGNRMTVDSSIRSSSYPLSHIGNSLSDTAITQSEASSGTGAASGITYTQNKLEILTNTSPSYSTSNFALIKDNFNANHTVTNTNLSGYTKGNTTTPESLGLEKYDTARDTLDRVLSGSTLVHGIHFMDKALAYNNTVSLNEAIINGQTYTNYAFPKSCIDFHLKEHGAVNFFGGAYYNTGGKSKADCFFSLSVIERNGNNLTSSSIKQISYIYKNKAYNKDDETSKKFIYKYSNNRYSDTNTTTASSNLGDLVFDMRYLSSTPPVQNSIYYFEIPVNKGEYALSGCSRQDSGGYLMYLDIGANGEAMDNVQAYNITTKKAENSYPLGVDFSPVAVAGNGGETICVSIDAAKTGSVTFGVTDNNIAITDTSVITKYSYKGTKYTEDNPPGNKFIVSGNSPGAMPTPPTGGTRVLYIHLVAADKSVYDIRITDILTTAEGAYNESQSKFEIDSGNGFVTSTKAQVAGLSNQIYLEAFRNLTKVAILTREGGTGEFTTTYLTETCKYVEKIVDVSIEKNGASMSIVVTSGYTFKIDGVTKPNGSTY